jgi:hypothetical protein
MRSSAEYPGGTLIGGMSHVEAILALHAGRYDHGGHKMATDAEIQKFVQRHHGFIPKMGSIAHVKEVHGIPTLRGADRARHERDVEPCPQEKREAIEEALRHFGVI